MLYMYMKHCFIYVFISSKNSEKPANWLELLLFMASFSRFLQDRTYSYKTLLKSSKDNQMLLKTAGADKKTLGLLQKLLMEI